MTSSPSVSIPLRLRIFEYQSYELLVAGIVSPFASMPEPCLTSGMGHIETGGILTNT
jgi:hypothetical protein